MLNEQKPVKFVFWNSWIYKTIIVILFYFILVGVVEKIDKQIKSDIKTFTTENSPLLSNTITFLAVDNQGKIWVGTYNGLYSISKDGIWSIYTDETSGLMDNEITALVVDKADNIWVGTDKGLFVVDRNGNWKTYIKYDYSNNRSQSKIKSLALDKNGRIWVGTNGGLFVFEGDKAIQSYTEDNSDLVDNSIWALAFDNSNRVWIGTWKGLNTLDQYDNWVTYQKDRDKKTKDGLSSNDIVTLLVDRKYNVWIGTECCGVNVIDLHGHWITDDIEFLINIKNSRIRDFALDDKNRIWVGTMEDGIIMIDPEGESKIYTFDNSGLPSYSIRTLVVDNNNQLWIGRIHEGGLSVIDIENLPKIAPNDWILLRKNILFPITTISNGYKSVKNFFQNIPASWSLCFISIFIIIFISFVESLKNMRFRNIKLFMISFIVMILALVSLFALYYLLLSAMFAQG